MSEERQVDLEAEGGAWEPEIEAEIRAFAASGGDVPGAHVEPERLAAYRAGTLPEAEADEIRAHLLACRECGDLLVDLDLWARGELGADLPPPSEFEIAAAWRGVRRAQDDAAASARMERVGPATRDTPVEASTFRSRRGPFALAAAALIAAIGLAFDDVALRRELSTPTANAPLVDLSATPERGDAETAATLALPRDARVFSLVLAAPPGAPEGPVAVEIAAGDGTGDSGRILWRGAGLEKNAGDSYTLAIPRRALSSARSIAIRLLDPADGHAVAVYHLNITNS